MMRQIFVAPLNAGTEQLCSNTVNQSSVIGDSYFGPVHVEGKFIGWYEMTSLREPGAMPLPGSPSASSYIWEQKLLEG